MSKIRQDRRSQVTFLLMTDSNFSHFEQLSFRLSSVSHEQATNTFFQLIPYQHIIYIYIHNEMKRGKGGLREGTLVENKRIEIKPQLRLKLTMKSDERAKLLSSLAEQMKKRDNDSTAQLLPPPLFSSDASNFFVRLFTR
ncbi:hypothetical protein T07_7875 [Trichinella nelsoni]|uniref:Uncharacterized protein n=1 Tax=Trichinella nelsoni TaxID=6336 RepID=A0A0V0SMS5_9BILA|nr:hypothetical protein T07_7875 [Trichinella nelsoni]